MSGNINKGINIATGYLQDNDAEILFDNDGDIITADGKNTYAKPYTKYEFIDTYRGGQQELDTSNLSRSGEFVIDEQKGVISFSSNIMEKEVVFEYISDGLQMAELKEEEIKGQLLKKKSLQKQKSKNK